MKTINESYSKKQRAEIASQLRELSLRNTGDWYHCLPELARYYVLRVLMASETWTFSGWLELHDLAIHRYPNGGIRSYIHDALNRLADELEAVK
jgi:hypothetical protein